MSGESPAADVFPWDGARPRTGQPRHDDVPGWVAGGVHCCRTGPRDRPRVGRRCSACAAGDVPARHGDGLLVRARRDWAWPDRCSRLGSPRNPRSFPRPRSGGASLPDGRRSGTAADRRVGDLRGAHRHLQRGGHVDSAILYLAALAEQGIDCGGGDADRRVPWHSRGATTACTSRPLSRPTAVRRRSPGS